MPRVRSKPDVNFVTARTKKKGSKTADTFKKAPVVKEPLVAMSFLQQLGYRPTRRGVRRTEHMASLSGALAAMKIASAPPAESSDTASEKATSCVIHTSTGHNNIKERPKVRSDQKDIFLAASDAFDAAFEAFETREKRKAECDQSTK